MFKFNKDKRTYNKMQKRHKKELIKEVKDGADFDWEFLHRLVEIKLKHILEYYETGINVWQVEESKNKIIKELKKACGYLNIINTEKISHNFYSTHCEMKVEDNKIEFKWDSEKNKKLFLEMIDKEQAEKNKAFENFYRYLGRHLRKWWD